MQQKNKVLETQIRDPVYLEDGSMIFDTTITTNEPDRDGEIVNPLGVNGLETAVIAYNHNKCSGVPVSTGAKILLDTVIQNEKELRVQILVKPTDEMFFCDILGNKKTNGKLLDSIKKDQVRNTSIGFRYNPEDVKTILRDGKKYTYYEKCILSEFSLLDVLSSNPKSLIHKFMKSEEEKQKCLNCLKAAGVGSYAINDKGLLIKIVEVTESKVTGQDFDGNTYELDDSFELIQTPESAEVEDSEISKSKACACQQQSKLKEEEKDSQDSLETKEVEAEDVSNNSMMMTILENQSKIMSMIESLSNKLDSLSSNQDEISKNIVEEVSKTFQSSIVSKFAKPESKMKILDYSPF